MAQVAAATDKRFRRAHVKPARRRPAWGRQAWLGLRVAGAVGLAAYGAWRGTALLAESPALQVSHLVVRGHERLAPGEVLALVDDLRGRNILTARLEGWRDRLLSSPWVRDATLRRVLPSTVEIVVEERRPMGVARIGDQMYLVDDAGEVVDEYGPAYADIDLPIIDGLTAPRRDAGTSFDPARVELAARLLRSLATRPEIARQVSQIDVGDLRNAVVILEGDTALLRLGDTAFVERLQQYLDLAPALRERVDGIDYVDLRFDDRLYVRPRMRRR